MGMGHAQSHVKRPVRKQFTTNSNNRMSQQKRRMRARRGWAT